MVIIISIGKRIFGSIRFKSFIIFIVVSVVPLIILSSLIISMYRAYNMNELRTEMYRKANTIATNIVVTGFFDDNAENSKAILATINAIAEGRTLIMNKYGSVVFDSSHIETGKLYATSSTISALKGKDSYYLDKNENISRVVVPIINSESGEILGAVLLASSYNNINNAVDQVKTMAMMVVFAFSLIIIVLSMFSASMLTRPLKKLITYINGVTEGKIDDKLTIKGYVEIEEISESFNNMIHRLFEIEDNRQQFVANVSHELKTPLSSVKVLAESLLAQENVPVEVYREFLEDINNEVDRESKIINDLLTLVTLDKKDNTLNITKVNMNELVESILKRLKPLAGKKNIQMIFESYRSVDAEIDETKLSLAITNLVENAIKYNKDFGLITTILNADHKEFELIIKDTGIGIPEDSIGNIFERFYRVDKTRSRDTGGTGLGLSIVQKTVLMHNGTIKCESEVEKGTKFTMIIPLKHIPKEVVVNNS